MTGASAPIGAPPRLACVDRALLQLIRDQAEAQEPTCARLCRNKSADW